MGRANCRRKMRLGMEPRALGTTAECVRDYCRMCQGVQENLLPPTGEFPYRRPRIDPSTGCRRLAGNNSSKSGGKLRVLRYFPRNPGDIPVFSGRLQDIPRDELPSSWYFGFPAIAIIAISFPYQICNYPLSKGCALAPNSALGSKLQGLSPRKGQYKNMGVLPELGN